MINGNMWMQVREGQWYNLRTVNYVELDNKGVLTLWHGGIGVCVESRFKDEAIKKLNALHIETVTAE